MKKFIFSCLAAFAAFSVSCRKEAAAPAVPEEGRLLLDLRCADPEVRAATGPDTTAQAYEKKIRKVDILVFDSDGRLDLHHAAGTALKNISLSVRTGQKEIWAVINGPDLRSVKRLTELKALQTQLDENAVTGVAQGFVMAGSGSCLVVPAQNTPCAISVSRFAARVALTRVQVSLPASYRSVIIKNVLLANVVANQNLAGTAQPQTWYNKKGRTENGTLIDGSSGRTAACPDLTFRASGTTVNNQAALPLPTPWFFYGYPNPTAQDPSDLSGTFQAQRSRLVVTAEIDGALYYYPVTLPVLRRNTAYEVALTIQGLGTSGPDMIPQKGSFSANVTIRSWENGATLNETI